MESPKIKVGFALFCDDIRSKYLLIKPQERVRVFSDEWNALSNKKKKMYNKFANNMNKENGFNFNDFNDLND